jgi:ABC-2 type transport system ATP-binding protein
MVEVDRVSRRFGSTVALDEVSYRAGEAKVYGLVGANGAGKTTLIKHLLGLFRAKSGSVRMFGMDPVRHPVEVLQRIGYLSEERDLPEWMRVDELMRYTQAFHPDWDMAYAHQLLDTFELDSGMKILELSRGMRAQVGIVAAVAHRPDLLILDEPSTGLDPVVRKDILDAMVRAVADDGRTVLFSSHLLDEVERMADHVTMIHQGRVVLDGTLESIRRAHARAQIRFGERLDQPPEIEGALSVEGEGRSWSVIHNGATEPFNASVARHRGEVVQSRAATLEEIFVARVGRAPSSAEAA